MANLVAIGLSLAAALCGVTACTQGAEPPAAAVADPEVAAVVDGWMGRFIRRDPELATLLAGNPGWGHLRDMALFEAVQGFDGGTRATDRIGAARAYLALADLGAALDQLLLEVESGYLVSQGAALTEGQRARLALVRLRQGRLEDVRTALSRPAPVGYALTWQLLRAYLARREGDLAAATRLCRDAPLPGSEQERLLAEVAGYLWQLPLHRRGNTPYDRALQAFRSEDLIGGVLSLQLLEFSPEADVPGPELLLYDLLRHSFAGLAAGALTGTSGAEASYLLAAVRGHQGDTGEAEVLYRKAAGTAGTVSAAALMFSPLSGGAELRALSRVHAGEAATAADPGPLVALARAAALAESSASQEDVSVATAAALQRLARTPAAFVDGAAVLGELYAARRAAGARTAARIYRILGADGQALDALERAHRKSSGYRPDFVNPPAFLVELAGAHQRVGNYAPAVAILFELAAEYPSSRVAYESLKRLYASRTGGEVPPR